MLRYPRFTRPLSLVTACALGAAGAASAMSVVFARLLFTSPDQATACEATTAEAEAAGLRVFEGANSDYDAIAARRQAETTASSEAEVAWSVVRDRYRLFLAYPEAFARWPELAKLAHGRAETLDRLVAVLVEMHQLEAEAAELEQTQQLEAEAKQAEAAMEAARKLTAKAHAEAQIIVAEQRNGTGKPRLNLGSEPDCTLGDP